MGGETLPDTNQGDRQDFDRLLERMQDGTKQPLALAQGFDGELGHVAITVGTMRGHATFRVSVERTLEEDVSNRATQYANLVGPRWGKGSLTNFLNRGHTAAPQDIYQSLKSELGKIIDFQDPADSDTVCCWLIGTYFYTLFDAYAYLAVLGPKGSGETKLGEVIQVVAFNATRSSSVTDATIFRLVDITGGTLILDEQEVLASKFAKGDYLGLLRDGYKKGSTVLRTREVGGDFHPQNYSAYSPRVLINTSGVEELLADRCIPIHMLRSTGGQGKALVSSHFGELQAIRDELYCLALQVFPQVREYYRDVAVAGTLNNRQRERWLPLLAIADVFCSDRFEEIEAKAEKDVGSNILTDPFDGAFLLALDSLVGDKPSADVTASEISTKMFDSLELSNPPSLGVVGRLISKYLGNIGRRSGEKGSNRYTIIRAQVGDLLRRYPTTATATEPTEGTEGTEGLSEEGDPQPPTD